MKILYKVSLVLLQVLFLIGAFVLSIQWCNLLSPLDRGIVIDTIVLKLELFAGLLCPLLGGLLFYLLNVAIKQSKSRLFLAWISLFLAVVIIYSSRSETVKEVSFDPKVMLPLTLFFVLLGIALFANIDSGTTLPNRRCAIKVLGYSAGIMWLAPFLSELVVLFRWQLEGTFATRSQYMVLGGAGLKDVLAYYGLVALFTVFIYLLIRLIFSNFLNGFLSKRVRTVIYNDANYPAKWVNDKVSSAIVNQREHWRARILNAVELRDFMRQAIEGKTAFLSLVVFSKDVVPDSILENYTINTLRGFLDAGGSILWIGDVPLYYVGHPSIPAKEQNSDEIWQHGVPLLVLGVNHSYSWPKKIVQLTNDGYELGLRNKWSGIRPIDYDRNLKTLAYSENLLANPYANIPRFRTLSKKFIDFVRRIKSVGPQGIEFAPEPNQTVPQTMAEQQKPQTRYHDVQLNAWVKTFNSDYRHSGFHRIWDRPLEEITENMLSDLDRIVGAIKSRLADQL
jgi:hypothetical protein